MRDSLWPEFKFVDENSPKVILEEQARFLSRATSQFLHGEVISSVVPNTLQVSIDLPYSNIPKFPYFTGINTDYSLYIVAPRLLNYRFELVSISYNPVDYYPLTISDAFALAPTSLPNEHSYILYLSSLFNSQKVQDVISKLVTQSRKGKRYL